MQTEPATLELPCDLLAAIDKVVEDGQAQSREALVELALRRELASLRRAAVDAEFLLMADDLEYKNEVRLIMTEFDHADSETSNFLGSTIAE